MDEVYRRTCSQCSGKGCSGCKGTGVVYIRKPVKKRIYLPKRNPNRPRGRRG